MGEKTPVISRHWTFYVTWITGELLAGSALRDSDTQMTVKKELNRTAPGIKLHLIVLVSRNKVKKKTCLLLTSCINFETEVRRVWFVIKSTEVICGTCNRYKRVLCFLWSLWALCDRYWKSISHMIHCYFIVVPSNALNIYVHCLPRENRFFFFIFSLNTNLFKARRFSLYPTKSDF